MNSTELLIRPEAHQAAHSNGAEFGEYGFGEPSPGPNSLTTEEGAQPLSGVFDERGFDSTTHTESQSGLQEEGIPGVITNDMPQGRHAAPYNSAPERYRGDRQLALLIEPEGAVEPQVGYVPRHAAKPRLESLVPPTIEQSRAHRVGRPLVQRVVSVFSPTKYLEGRSFSRRPRWKY